MTNEVIDIRDNLSEHFSAMGLSVEEYAVITILLNSSKYDGVGVYITNKELAYRIGRTIRTITRLKTSLKDKGFIKTYFKSGTLHGKGSSDTEYYDLNFILESIDKAVTIAKISPKQSSDSCTEPKDLRQTIRAGLRFNVLSRDKFRCVICGVSPATQADCQLHVDHIMPFSKGGLTTMDNLRTLCMPCNMGKGNKVP
jgi:5-methylcytosine-specific restriction endonuclease McrA